MFEGLPLPPSAGFSDIDDFGHNDQVAQLWDAYFDAYEAVFRTRLFGECFEGKSGHSFGRICKMGSYDQENEEQRYRRSGVEDGGSIDRTTRPDLCCGDEFRQSQHLLRRGGSAGNSEARSQQASSRVVRQQVGDRNVQTKCIRLPLPVPPSTKPITIRNREWLAARAFARWQRYYALCATIAGFVISGFDDGGRHCDVPGSSVVSQSSGQSGESVGHSLDVSRTVSSRKSRLAVRFVENEGSDDLEDQEQEMGYGETRAGYGKYFAPQQQSIAFQQQPISAGGLGNSFLRRLSPDAVTLDDDQRKQRSKLKRAKKMNKQRQVIPEISKAALGYSEGLAELAKVSSRSSSELSNRGNSSFRRTPVVKDARVASWLESRINAC